VRTITRTVKKRIRYYRAVLADPLTPRISRWLLGAAVAYALMPFDLIPDWIPFFGQLDDLVIVPLLVYLALRLVPEQVLVAHRK